MKTKIVSVAMIVLVLMGISCGSKEQQEDKKVALQDEQLSGFMLGGIYFLKGYGGQSQVDRMLQDYKTPEELVEGYKQIFEFPFEASQKRGTQSMLKNMWDITDKSTLMASIKDLQTRDYKYKAWDYARIVNNACMGYSAGYLSKNEVLEINGKTLPLARGKYKDWDAYYTDFNLGRIEWNAEDKDSEAFEKLAKNITKSEKSLYKVLPLQ